MAGIATPGALAPVPSASLNVPTGSAYRVPTTTRTRRNHGVFIVGDQLACVYSTRRTRDVEGVQLVLGHEGPIFTGGMTPTQARAVARALVAAADAAEAQQQCGRA